MDLEKMKDILESIINGLEPTWDEMYKLATRYFECYGNVDMEQKFKTLNGYEYNKYGVSLGLWIYYQKRTCRGKGAVKITREQVDKLAQIGIKFQLAQECENWDEMYFLAQKFFEVRGNLEVPLLFKTINGYEYAQNGIDLGGWIQLQRFFYAFGGITDEQIERLNKIQMRFELSYDDNTWKKYYYLAKKYYEYYGNLDMPSSFKTLNGIVYDEKGSYLGSWLNDQRQTYKGNRKGNLNFERKKLLEQIGFNFELSYNEITWRKYYELAKDFFEINHHLNVPSKYKTSDGYSLGRWVYRQKYLIMNDGKMDEEKVRLLKKIGMNLDNMWMKCYNLVKVYYKHYNNLALHQDFKTINGFEYNELGINIGRWLDTQRQVYRGNRKGSLSADKIEMLERLGMKWFSSSSNARLQKELITDNNIDRKHKELENRVYSFLFNYEDVNKLDKDDINNKFMECLNDTKVLVRKRK